MEWFVYIIRSLKRKEKIYIGSSNDLERRIIDHNRGNTRSTRYFRPWEIIHSETYQTKKEALAREKQLKRWKNRERIESLIERNRRP